MNERSTERLVARGFSWLSAGALALAGLYAGNNPDTFGHLAQGRQIAELGHVPQFDTWSLLPGPPRPWHNYEWLSDLLYYRLYAAFGYDGLIAFKCTLLASLALLLCFWARTVAGSRAVVLTSLALISTIPVVRVRMSDRPHVIGWCLAAVYMVILSRLIADERVVSRRKRWAWMGVIFALHVLWVNLHGSHLLGAAIAGAFAAFAPRAHRRDLFMLLGLLGAASCISPFGIHIVTDAIGHVLDPRYRNLVSEWQPWSAEDPPWLQLGPALQGMLLTLVAPRLFRVNPSVRATLSVALLLGVASFRSIRFIGEFMLLTAPLLGAGYALLFFRLKDADSATSRRFYVGAFAVLAALSLLVPWGAAALPPYRGISHGALDADLPWGPGNLLRTARLPPRVYASMDNSWPMMWQAPNARFIVDGRLPFYGPDHARAITRAWADDRLFDSIVRSADVNAVVLKYVFRPQRKRVSTMAQRPGWSLVLVDDSFVLYARDDLLRASGYQPLLRLRPDYAPDWVINATPAERAEIAAELSHLRGQVTARSYRHWILALLELAPLARAGADNGFRWPESAQDWQRYERAETYLAAASEGIGDLPIVASIRALVQSILCDFEGADASLARAAREKGLGREGLLAAQELALRRGELGAVGEFLRAARALPQAADDPWLRALSLSLDARPACPPEARRETGDTATR